MVDIKRLIDKKSGNWLNVEIVQNSKYEKAVIMEEGQIVTNTYDDASKDEWETTVKTQDSQIWNYKPNVTSMRNLQKAWGTDTKQFVDKTIILKVEAIRIGKDTKLGLIAYPNKPEVQAVKPA